MKKFKASLEIIGINPFVFVPERILNQIFIAAGKDKGHIPVRGTVNSEPYIQTLLRYKGEWRLYINTTMLKDSPKRIGETITVEIEYDPVERKIKPHPQLIKALKENKQARKVFESLAPSMQKEIVRYISYLKTEKSVTANIQRCINFLMGNGSFAGRDKP
jgi:hypothetical protein